MFVTHQVDATDEPVSILTVPDGADNVSGRSVVFQNLGPDVVYFGGSDEVTDDDGAEVAVDDWSPALALDDGDDLFVVCAADDTADVRVVEVGV